MPSRDEDIEARRAYHRLYKAANRAKVNAYNREWRKRHEAANPEAVLRRRAAEKRWRDRNPDKIKEKTTGLRRRNVWLRHKFGIDQAQYEALLQAQGGVCAICGSDKPVKKNAYLVVDHNRKTKAIRGVLCDGCNMALGRFRDDVAYIRRVGLFRRRRDLVEKAIAYLEGSNASVVAKVLEMPSELEKARKAAARARKRARTLLDEEIIESSSGG